MGHKKIITTNTRHKYCLSWIPAINMVYHYYHRYRKLMLSIMDNKYKKGMSWIPDIKIIEKKINCRWSIYPRATPSTNAASTYIHIYTDLS